MSSQSKSNKNDLSSQAKSAAWQNYWQSGAVGSSLDAPMHNYQGNIRNHWEVFFEQLTNQSVLLDICTGNGAIALIAAESSKNLKKDFSIYAVDQAVINPSKNVNQQTDIISMINFIGNTAAENLPFPDNHFDAIAGQYALEYTQTEQTIDEITRVLKPNGKVMFIMHHWKSIINNNVEEQITQINHILQTEIFDQVTQLIITDKNHDIALAKQLKAQFSESAQYLVNINQKTNNQSLINGLLHFLGELFANRNQIELPTIKQNLEKAKQDLQYNLTRLLDFQQAVLQPSDLEKLKQQLKKHAFHNIKSFDVFHQPEHCVGLCLAAQLKIDL